MNEDEVLARIYKLVSESMNYVNGDHEKCNSLWDLLRPSTSTRDNEKQFDELKKKYEL